MKNIKSLTKTLFVVFFTILFTGMCFVMQNNIQSVYAEDTRSRQVTITCGNCHGAGEHMCTYCMGTGLGDMCDFCFGEGGECENCQGSGKLLCSLCNGNKNVTCTECNGNKTKTVEGYLLTFDSNGVTPNETLIQPDAIAPNHQFESFQTLTANGYTFLGWSTDKYAETASTNAGDTLIVKNDNIFYAIWKSTGGGGDSTPSTGIYFDSIGLYIAGSAMIISVGALAVIFIKRKNYSN